MRRMKSSRHTWVAAVVVIVIAIGGYWWWSPVHELHKLPADDRMGLRAPGLGPHARHAARNRSAARPGRARACIRAARLRRLEAVGHPARGPAIAVRSIH